MGISARPGRRAAAVAVEPEAHVACSTGARSSAGQLAATRERLERAGARVDAAADGAVVSATPDRVPVRLEEG